MSTPSALPVTFTIADLVAIDKAIASGVLTVNYPEGGGGLTYRSIEELLKAREKILEYLVRTGQITQDALAVGVTTQSLAVKSRS
jgi:hypothetical protein